MLSRKSGSLYRFLKSSLLWTLLIIYVVLPVTVLLLFRGPEAKSTFVEVHHVEALVKGGLVLTLMTTFWRGWHGLVICLAIGIGAFKYEMDARLCRLDKFATTTTTSSLKGKVAVVTGSNRGIGFATAKMLAEMGAHVIMTCRSVERCRNAVKEVNAAGQKANGGTARSAILTLGSLESAYNLTRELRNEYPSIHYLFCNAGATPQYNLTEEGLEDGFGGMHLAHAAVTLGLLPSLRNAGETSSLGSPARIIMTSSDIALNSACGLFGSPPFSLEFMEGSGEGDLRGETTRGDGTTYASLGAYGRAKLCNILFAFQVNRRLAARKWPVLAHAVHTGAVHTSTSSNGVGGTFQGIPGLPYLVSHFWAPLLWRSPKEGAQTLLYSVLATHPPSMAEGGQYVNAICRPTPTVSSNATFEKMTVRLWGNKSLTFYMDRWEALKAANDKWAARLWDVSLGLLEKSPARSVVQFAP